MSLSSSSLLAWGSASDLLSEYFFFVCLVTWHQTACFILAGVIPQALDAIARLHEAGWAHRSLSPSCFYLSALQGMHKNVAIQNSQNYVYVYVHIHTYIYA